MKQLKSKNKERRDANSGFRFGIVVSTYHQTYTFGMLRAAEVALLGHQVDVVEVPGAFEIPLQVQRLAKAGTYHAILALGVIWQGQTFHAQEILRASTDALMRISLEHDVAVLHEILSVRTEKEVTARTLGKKLNRGTEAALAALAVAKLVRK